MTVHPESHESAALPPAGSTPMPGGWGPQPASWIAPAESGGISRYVDLLRSGRWIILGTLVLCVGIAVLYLSQASKVYEASADILVSPQSSLPVPVQGIIMASSDPTQDVETAAKLVTSPSVVQRVIAQLHLRSSVQGVIEKVSAAPVASSNLVTVTAKGGTPRDAAQLANAFATQFVADRTERLRATVNGQITRLKAALGPGATTSAADATPDSPAAQLRFLQTLSQGPDPSVGVESQAVVPTSATSPRPVLTAVAAVFGGLVLGLLGALGLQLLDPRLRSEDQLRARFRLPILARIPVERRRLKRPLLPNELSLGVLDGYQALRASLEAPRHTPLAGRVVLVTGPSPGDGKTTAAINLASLIAAAGKRVILIEADSRRPSIGRALGMKPEIGLARVVTGHNYLVDALLPVGEEPAKLRVLLTSPDEGPSADILSRLSTDTLLLQAQRLADWVIVDSPPLNHVAETLALARAVDDVVVVVRVGRTNTEDLGQLAELLAQQDITPAGFVVLGGQARRGYY